MVYFPVLQRGLSSNFEERSDRWLTQRCSLFPYCSFPPSKVNGVMCWGGAGMPESLSASDSEWRVNGRRGIIQASIHHDSNSTHGLHVNDPRHHTHHHHHHIRSSL